MLVSWWIVAFLHGERTAVGECMSMAGPLRMFIMDLKRSTDRITLYSAGAGLACSEAIVLVA